MDQPYQFGLLCLAQLLISADEVVDEAELEGLRIIKAKESIEEDFFRRFEAMVRGKKEKEIFQMGIDALTQCTLEEKVHVFVMLYKLSEIDGRVHVKEIRLLLYSLKLTGIEFDDVVGEAMKTPSLNLQD